MNAQSAQNSDSFRLQQLYQSIRSLEASLAKKPTSTRRATRSAPCFATPSKGRTTGFHHDAARNFPGRDQHTSPRTSERFGPL